MIKEKLIALTDETVKLPNIEGNYKKYKVNVDHLFLNPYNDRFAMELSESENINKKKVGYDFDSQQSLQKLLWESNKEKNNKTLQDIVKNGLLRDIVIDLSGTVLDGNRRVTIVRKILEKLRKDTNIVNRFQYIDVVLIEKKLSEKEIREFETILQMSEDEKLEYNPINVYIKISNLMNNSLKTSDKEKIADVAYKMGAKYTISDVTKRLKIFNEMKNYLIDINNSQHFKMLDGRQDMFAQLQIFKENFRNKKLKCEYDLNFSNYERVSKILNILIALKYETHKFRAIIPGIKNITKTPLATLDGLKNIEEAFVAEGIYDLFEEYKISRVNDDSNNIDEIVKNIFSRAEKFMENSGKSSSVESAINTIGSSASSLHMWVFKNGPKLLLPSQKQKVIEDIDKIIESLETVKKGLMK